MSETKNLKLFKHDEPLETNENYFDVDKALNQNWDKIDEFATINSKVIELQEQIKKDRENMINLEVEGQSIHIEDSSNLEGQLEVLGNVEQETREGYNILENILTDKTVNGITVKINKDKSITLNGTATSNTSLDITGNFAITEQSVFSGMCDGYGYNKMLTQIQGADYNVNIPNSTSQVLQPKDNVKVRIFIYAGTSITNALIKPQINKGTVAKPYEAYGISPSPEYPSKTKAVGDNINLFNKNGNILLEYDTKLEPIENGIKAKLTVAGTSKYGAMKLGGSELLGKTLIVHGDVIFSGKNDTLIGFYFGKDANFNKNWISDSGVINKEYPKIERTFKIPDIFPKDTDTIYILIYSNAHAAEAKVGDYVEYRNFKIEEGEKATSYSDFGQGSVEIKKQNKNLLENKAKTTTVNGVTFTVNTDGTVMGKGTATSLAQISLVANIKLPAGTYTIKDAKAYVESVNFTGWWDGLNNPHTQTFNTELLLKNVYIQIKQGETVSNKTFYPQINKGTVAKEYAKHKEETYILPIQKPMLEGDHFAKEVDGWKEIHNWKQKIFDGTENWVAYKDTQSNAIGFGYNYQDGQKDIVGLSNYFVPSNTDYMTGTLVKDIEGLVIRYNYIKISRFKREIPDAESLKKWLKKLYDSSNPLYVYYALVVPIKLPCTPEQTKILEELDNIQTYKTATNITTDSIAKLKLKYIADTKTYIDNKVNNLEQQVGVINQLLSTTKTSSVLLDNLQTDIEREVL